MIFQQPQARVCLGSQSWEASSPVAQLEAVQLEEALRQRQQIGVAPGLLGQRFPIIRERAWTLAADNADDENGGVANWKLRISRTSRCEVIGGLRC
jgi:hypothetical protein